MPSSVSCISIEWHLKNSLHISDILSSKHVRTFAVFIITLDCFNHKCLAHISDTVSCMQAPHEHVRLCYADHRTRIDHFCHKYHRQETSLHKQVQTGRWGVGGPVFPWKPPSSSVAVYFLVALMCWGFPRLCSLVLIAGGAASHSVLGPISFVWQIPEDTSRAQR